METVPYDYQLKILLVGDSGVGKSSLLLRFTDSRFDDLSPTIGVDFKQKFVDIAGKRVKLTLWDTAGQERFRTLTSSYYRGAQGIVYVYDISRAETLESIPDIWLKEVELYSTVPNAVQMIVGNKLDLDNDREVEREQAMKLAKRNGCLFVETSAKVDIAVEQAFQELLHRILETPDLAAAASQGGVKAHAAAAEPARSGCC